MINKIKVEKVKLHKFENKKVSAKKDLIIILTDQKLT